VWVIILKKLALGIGTLVPIPYIVWVLSQPAQSHFGGWHPLHLVVLVIMVTVWAYYFIDVFRNDRIPDDKKALWAGLILFGNLAVEPIYFWRFVWKSDAA
jgi:hypothetical protein